jgi:hypothetical protein
VLPIIRSISSFGPVASIPSPTALLGFHPANVLAGNATPCTSGVMLRSECAGSDHLQKQLPPTHILPVDTTIPGANQAHNRTAVHIHGGFVRGSATAATFDWWAPEEPMALAF